MAENQRQQLVVERILEDESLRGDLDDTAAQALLTWATGTAGTIAADTTLSDAEVDNKVQAVRRAALIAAGSGVSDPTLLVAQAACSAANRRARCCVCQCSGYDGRTTDIGNCASSE